VKEMAQIGVSQRPPLIKNMGYPINTNEIGEACGKCGGQEKYIPCFGEEI